MKKEKPDSIVIGNYRRDIALSIIAQKHLERVLVLPVFADKEGDSRPIAHILIFGYNEIVRKGTDLIVLLGNQGVFDYLPFKVSAQYEEIFQNRKKSWMYEAKSIFIKNEPMNNRTSLPSTVEEIKIALQISVGFWKKFEQKRLNLKTKRLCTTHHFFSLFEENDGCLPINYCLALFKGSHFLCLRDVYNQKHRLSDRATKPDPYGVTAEFLRRIGEYPVRISGQEKRPGRLNHFVWERIISALQKICKKGTHNERQPTRDEAKAAYERHTTRPAMPHTIREVLRKYRLEKNLLA